ncbi:hypothetical protein [Streptomyces sp. NBC_00272]|uniref:hypothetical protein n=1 Tax=Streptomyces sp. NBC_00272 TaxID=2975698 RepID=UPI002E298FD9|nr:hypothetical protein [Streptomyces sp. NBC_00272]
MLAERFRELAFLNRDQDISLTDERPRGRSRSVRYRFPGGARDFVAFLDAQERASVHPDTISFEREFGHPQRGRHRRRRADGPTGRRADGPTGGIVADEELLAQHRLELPFGFVPSSAA